MGGDLRANGLGIGVPAAIPKKTFPPKVRARPPEGFPPGVIGALWRGQTTPLPEAFWEELKQRAAQMAGNLAGPPNSKTSLLHIETVPAAGGRIWERAGLARLLLGQSG